MNDTNVCENVSDKDICNSLNNCHYCVKWYTCEYIPGYHDDISSMAGWFIIAYILQICCFIFILWYLVRYLHKLIYPTLLPDELYHIVDKIIANKTEKVLYFVVIPIAMLLCLVCISADFYHLLLPLIESNNDKDDDNRYPCGIRDANFKVTRIVADASQFWGFLIYWGIMGYKLVISFHGSPFAIKKISKICLGLLFGVVMIITIIYNALQFNQTDDGTSTSILFSVYTVTSILLNVFILFMYCYKLNELIILDIAHSGTDPNQDELLTRQQTLLKSMTKCAVLIGIQLIAYAFRYFYRIIIIKPDINNRNQFLYIVSYTGRDIMCVAMVIALYYGCSFIKNEYNTHCKRCNSCCGRICYKITRHCISVNETKDNNKVNSAGNDITFEDSVPSDTGNIPDTH